MVDVTLVPESFKVRMSELFGQKGAAWLDTLPDLLEKVAGRFGVRLEAPFTNLSYNLLLKVTRQDGSPAVVKLGVEKSELGREKNALQAYAGRGAIRVFDAEEDWGALLLERVEPGTPLSKLEADQAATEIFCEVFQRSHKPGLRWNGHFPTLQDHFAAIERYCRQSGEQKRQGPLPVHWVERAVEHLDFLFATTKESVLLHGDLHHDNILLQEGDRWTVIDPKGYVGDRHFDVIQFLLNYQDRGGDPSVVLERRLETFSQRLGLDGKRIAMWGVARGVLEACWALEGGGDWENGIRITERFAEILDGN